MNKEERLFLQHRFYQIEAPKIMNSLNEDISKHIVPIYTEDDLGIINILGNTVLIQYGSHCLLISARHVLDHCINGIYFLIKGDFVFYNDYKIYNHQIHDLGFVLLSDELSIVLKKNYTPFEGEIFKDWNDWDVNSFKKFGLHGFPEFLFKNDEISHISMILDISKMDIYKRKNVDFETHKLFVLSKGKSLVGKNISYEELYGISGTGMWMFEFYYSSGLFTKMSYRLFGIVIEYGKSAQYSLKTIDIGNLIQIPEFYQIYKS